MALGSTQPLTETSTRNLPGGKGRPARKADLTAICEPTVYKMWDPRRLANPIDLHDLLQGQLYLSTFLYTKIHLKVNLDINGSLSLEVSG
jgi:hypothetical protein